MVLQEVIVTHDSGYAALGQVGVGVIGHFFGQDDDRAMMAGFKGKAQTGYARAHDQKIRFADQRLALPVPGIPGGQVPWAA
jgi:hypothetical protein